MKRKKNPFLNGEHIDTNWVSGSVAALSTSTIWECTEERVRRYIMWDVPMSQRESALYESLKDAENVFLAERDNQYIVVSWIKRIYNIPCVHVLYTKGYDISEVTYSFFREADLVYDELFCAIPLCFRHVHKFCERYGFQEVFRTPVYLSGKGLVPGIALVRIAKR